jgi:hypothetical protein
MKKFSIEEKAKRYDEVINQLRTMMPNWENLSYNGKTFLQDIVHIIPELKESDDERIIDNLTSQLCNLYTRKLIKEETKDKYVNWLKSLKERIKE